MNLYGYSLSLTVVEYQTAVLRGDMEAAAEILPAVPKDQMNKVARFLEGRGLFANNQIVYDIDYTPQLT